MITHDKCASFQEVIEAQEKRIKELEEQNKKLLKTVEFYADEMNYDLDDYDGTSGEMLFRCVLNKDMEERNDVYSYAGMRARKTLKEIKGE